MAMEKEGVVGKNSALWRETEKRKTMPASPFPGFDAPSTASGHRIKKK
jgi:hypothetical protein